jgi:IclR family acetate operon transcriptional repressor
MSRSAERALDVVEALAAAESDLSLSELQAELGLPLPTLHRLIGMLTERGYAVRHEPSRRYGPGPKLLAVAASATSRGRFDLRRVAIPVLREVTAQTGETSNLISPYGRREIVYIEQVLSPQMVRMFTEVGHRAPLYCTAAGKAILAALFPQQLEEYLAEVDLEALTPGTITSRKELRREIEVTRERGFAVDDEERAEGVRCVAGALLNHAGICVGAISVSGPSTRMSLERTLEIGPQVRNWAAECSRRLGYASIDGGGSLDTDSMTIAGG